MANALLGMASVVNDPHENFNVCVDRLDAMQGLCDSIFDRELAFCVLCSNAYGWALVVHLFIVAGQLPMACCVASPRLLLRLPDVTLYCVCSFLRWQCKFSEVPHSDAIRRERAELGCKIFDRSHKLARRALGAVPVAQ